MKRSIVIILILFLISGCASNDVVKVEESINDTNIKDISEIPHLTVTDNDLVFKNLITPNN